MTPPAPPPILVADDEEEMRHMLEHFVSSQGYAVHTAASGDEAWEKVQRYRPDLVLLDVRMPGLSGWEVSRNIAHTPELAHTRVIVITGIGERVNELTSPLFGAFAYIDKPFDISELEAKIQAALGPRAVPSSHGISASTASGSKQSGLQPPKRKTTPTKPAAGKQVLAKAAAKKPTSKPALSGPNPKKSATKKPAKPAVKKSAPKQPASKKR
ncbi:MAG: response regulator [Myxococcales bacterium]|nr:response regulator [Myxococcales bacterium]